MAQGPANGVSEFANVKFVFDLTDEERGYQNYYDDDLENRKEFRQYVIGFKLHTLGLDRKNYNVVYAFLDDYQADVDARKAKQNVPGTNFVRYREAGKAAQDPRLDPHNFQLSGILDDYLETLPLARRSSFEAFVFGRKLWSLDHSDANDQSHIDIWKSPEDTGEYEKLGKEWFFRFLEQGAADPTQRSGSSAHIYLAGELPPARAADVNEVNSNMSRGDGSGWVFERTIYQGRAAYLQRIVHFFARVDELDYIKERMVVKIQGAYTKEAATAMVAREFDLHARLSGTGCAHILKAWASSVRSRREPPHLAYIYMDWAPFGTLQDLYRKYLATGDDARQIPEPMLWLIFRGLAEALLLMLTGTVIDSDEPPGPTHVFPTEPGWKPIVNTDIKDTNVVLGHAAENYYTSYKTPQMIDFGLAFDNGKFSNRAAKRTELDQWATNRATIGWRAPEAYYLPCEKFEDEAIDSRSDLWQVGLVMLNLMEGARTRLDHTKQKLDHTLQHTPNYDRTYSRALESLVFDCLTADPTKRPSLSKVLYETRRGLTSWQKAYGDVSEDEVMEMFRVPLEEEEQFPVHTVLAGRKRRRGELDPPSA